MTGRLRSNDACWCGSRQKLKRCHGDHARYRRPPVVAGDVGPMRTVPDHIVRPPYVGAQRLPGGLQIFTSEADLDALRRAAVIAAEVLADTAAAVAEGVTTDELDAVAHAAYVQRGAYPSTLGYGTYTKSICTSVNEIVCHGIPDDRPLAAGDIVNLDVTAYVDGFHGDTSATFIVGGTTDAPTAALVDLTRRSLEVGIAAVRPGRPTRDIGRAIQAFAHAHGLGVVADYGGHGIGRTFHAPPHIVHVDDPSSTTEMVPGLVFTIEPMLTAGRPEHVLWDDDWTVATADGLPTAQFEHTVLVTEAGADVLTVAPPPAVATEPAASLTARAGAAAR